MDKVAREVAEAEFDRFIESNAIILDLGDSSEDDRKEVGVQRARIVGAVMAGSLVFDENGEPIFTPQRTPDAEPIHFREPTGAALMAMDRKKAGADIGKLYATMGEITGMHAKTFSSMKVADLHICMAITALFLG